MTAQLDAKEAALAQRRVEDFAQRIQAIRRSLHEVVVGQDRTIDLLLTCALTGSHALLLGVPGLAKTLMVKALASAFRWKFNRVQFTPDLMPSDITGYELLGRDEKTNEPRMVFRPGPVFANLVLADEINRAAPKTQSALLEAMAEQHVTVGGQTYPLEEPFLVVATQNPIEQEGTYPLPEAQLDRFMMEIHIDYPTPQQEEQIVNMTSGAQPPLPSAAFDKRGGLCGETVRRQPAERSAGRSVHQRLRGLGRRPARVAKPCQSGQGQGAAGRTDHADAGRHPQPGGAGAAASRAGQPPGGGRCGGFGEDRHASAGTHSRIGEGVGSC